MLLRFPFSDLSGAKLRPVVVLVVLDGGDFLAVQITSQRKANRRVLELTKRSFAEGSLRKISFVLPSKLFTADRKIIVKRVGRLKDFVQAEVRQAVIQMIRGNG